MNILAIETSTGANGVAVAANLGAADERWTVRTEPRATARAEPLLPLIAEALAAAGLSFPAIDLIAVCSGPGSFTGIRAGLAAARGLALASGRPVVGASSLDVRAIAAARRDAPEGRFAVVVDAGKGDVYLATYERDATPIAPPELVAAAELSAKLAGVVVVYGPAAAFVGVASLATARIVDTDAPDVTALARMAPRLPRDVPASPLYIRPADAKPPVPSSLLAKAGP